MATSPVDQQLHPSPPCTFAEITQHICEVKESKFPGQPPKINCFPLPRILKMFVHNWRKELEAAPLIHTCLILGVSCQGKPATEITKEVEISHDGHVRIPSSSQ